MIFGFPRFATLLVFFFLVLGCQTKVKKTEKVSAKVLVNSFQFPKFNSVPKSFSPHYYDSISAFYRNRIAEDFNGMFLIAKNGEIVYERYKGFANEKFNKRVDKHTPLHVASISKVVTALIICKLVDSNQVVLDKDIRSYLPEIMYEGITVRMLLNHRSGIPYYGYFPYTIWPATKNLTNQKIIQLLNQYKMPLYFPPNSQFSYCNTNYALLALIAERVTQKKFPKIAKEFIFEPLGMTDSFINDGRQNSDTIARSYDSRNRLEPFTNLDGIYGDKNLYTTARDLLKLDKATYSNDFLSASIKKEIFRGYSYERKGKSNYGLGFRMREDKGKSSLFFHTGWWHGNTGCYASLRKDTICMIIISNHYTKKVFGINRLSTLFGNYPYEPLIDTKENFIKPNDAKSQMTEAIRKKKP
ncbi:serine hydrolase domain-containing protein [Fluviicola taffensis]|uniref:Beta-lactamase n=1 Tax=Fluviicola taffensis (strain DSM 16823 / NCIMB 13979 / RW262) TaxID=755732 RepID=F2IE57_FLUTR|nr:serine hydrolase domain-containing protein [Fluviicola taffensis]AEA42375.1 beta-lactamase [Fluviicola taffensis DSM 16823]